MISKSHKPKIKFKNICSKRFIFILILLLLLPLTIIGTYQAKQLFTKAQSAYTYKVTRNHQYTCEEQIEWGNHVIIYVKDENDRPLAGVKVEYWHDYRADVQGQLDDPPPTGVLTTDDSGMADFDNRSPGCLPCPNGTDHRTNFFFKVKDAPSDTAVEVSSGYFGDECGALFCPGMHAINVWGHWMYNIEFRRTPGSLQEEEIPTDHAGQSRRQKEYNEGKCRFWHIYMPYESYNPRRGSSIASPTSYPTVYPTLPSKISPSPTSYSPLAYPTATSRPYQPIVETRPPQYPTQIISPQFPTRGRITQVTLIPTPLPPPVIRTVGSVMQIVVDAPQKAQQFIVQTWKNSKPWIDLFLNTILP